MMRRRTTSTRAPSSRTGRCISAVVLLSCTLAGGAARAQSALVLSGGGARGLAHVGVLTVLEELGYDPDLVVGTSMGAVVGALYAAGYSPEEIRSRILAIRWQDVFAPTPLIVGPQRETRWPMLTVGMDARRQRVQRGLFGVWRINRGLTHLLFDATARSRGDFDRLPRRYRAVAADLKTGATVVLDSGDVARAVRASMAIPGFFAPLEWDDRMLTDGGIADNLPIGLARRLGAQHIVAVEVSRPTADIHDLAPISVMQRALDLMQDNAQRSVAPPDVLVLPEIDAGVSGMSFPDDARPLIELGVAAARRDLPRAPAPPARAPRELPAPRTFDAVRIEAPDSALAALARHAFAGIAGSAYDVAAVLRAVDRLYTTGLVEAVWTRVVDDAQPDDSPTLVVRVEAPPPMTFDAAAGFENDRGGRAWGALTRYVPVQRRPLLLSLAAATDGLERDVSLSATNVLLGRPVLAWSVGGYASEHNVRTFPEDAVVTQDIVRAGGWIGLEFPRVLRDRLTTAAVRAEWIDVEGDGHGYSVGPLLRFSALNPETMVVGVPFLVEVERRWGELSYTRANVRGSFEHALAMLRLAALVDARAVSHGAPADVWPALGNEHMMPGLRWGQERAPARLVAGIDAAYPVRGAFARLHLRAGTGEALRHGADTRARLRHALGGRWTVGARIGSVWRSPLGLLEADYAINTRGHGRFDISVGRDF